MIETSGNKPARSFALMAIALCFFGSALLRGGLVAEAANDAMTHSDHHEETLAQAGDHSEPDVHQKKLDCNAAELIAQLKSREVEFERRESALLARTAKLDVVAARVEERIAAMEQARTSLEQTIARVDGAQARDIDRLVVMYSTMKPKRAGELFNQMDVRFASELLVRIKPEIAALILSSMESEKAFTASLMIARRNQAAPKN